PLVWVFASIVVMVLIAFIGFMLMLKTKKAPADYRMLFVLGIIWIAVGVHLANYALLVVGLILFVVGLNNKNKWHANRTRWEKITKAEKETTALIMVLIIIVIAIGIAVFSTM
ncbi:MAG: hypothetical protein NT120_03415, partial [Candidatus Aenigmarchaeota archaeon]|nr:hypothetical protein [Candidatus Aenigmarchaeota archaeon]